MTQQQNQQVAPSQYAASAIDLAVKNLGSAIGLVEGSTPEQGEEFARTPGFLLGVAEIQTRVATAAALMDLANAIRETNPGTAIFNGLGRVASAIADANKSPGYGDARR